MSASVIFGFHAIEALVVARPKAIVEVVYVAERQDQRLQNLLAQLEKLHIKATPSSKEKIEQFVPEDAVHQGVIALVRKLEEFGENHIEEIVSQKEKPFFLILDGITDPHNLGACLRSAEAAGVDAVIIPKDKSASLTAVARKISSGASEVLPVIKVTNLARTLKRLQTYGVWIVGTAGEAQENIYQYQFPNTGLALVMGNEGKGMRRLTRENCDALVKIPMAGIVSSLNVSVATGVCLFEIVRQLNKFA
ncbi:23S rRNA (guanosine(2251)-2'-O)-methyltransferase RlmB [Psittacicella melopsittaci]|uniref:23S rRNA (guanosine-2'-O-)-methyltransferase RlmB n=1 Tax=Psittacicella melopsittaci TaxID=2028576 RepID=A0A3A1Y9D9_9GAMM|nr:23S rRNA (guanosine(2251)-2'-O)-methyltransferase RlmB [Psittacicella melopsittaci]RIY32727.1 23S rRNA (guanosine(2251)-2'-O)-methyltransferase RlmB [Psittacicella melopsittaci]